MHPLNHTSQFLSVAEIFARWSILADQMTVGNLAVQGGQQMGAALRLLRFEDFDRRQDSNVEHSDLLERTAERLISSVSCTMQQAFEQHYLSSREQDPAKSTKANIRTTLKLWEDFCSNTRIPDPSVRHVTKSMITDWRKWLLEQGDSPATVDRRWRELRSLMNAVEPGITAKIKLRALSKTMVNPEDRGMPRTLSAAELDALYVGCDVATWPPPSWWDKTRKCRVNNPVPAPLFWRCSFVTWFITGLRRQDVVSLTPGFSGLNLKHLHRSPECPVDGTMQRWSDGWIKRVPQKTKRHGKMLVLPMHRVLRGHLDQLIRLRSEVDRWNGDLFICPHSPKEFATTWQAIVADAQRQMAFRPCHIHDLRRTCNQLWNSVKLGLGKIVLCHEEQGANLAYTNVIPELVAAVSHLPIPDRLMSGAAPQKTLF